MERSRKVAEKYKEEFEELSQLESGQTKIGTVYSKHRRIEVNPLVNAATQMIIGGSFQVIIGFSILKQIRYPKLEKAYLLLPSCLQNSLQMEIP